jgi:hypothetical protein
VAAVIAGVGYTAAMPLNRFSIRDILFVSSLVAVLLGWWIDRHRVSPVAGRFQLGTPNNGQTLILDTATGQVWYQPQAGFNDPKIK